MSKKRSRLEIIRDILDILRKRKEVKITPLIYRSNLSNNSIKAYLHELLESKLISNCGNGGRKAYKIEDKGMRFLEEFNKMKLISDAYGLG